MTEDRDPTLQALFAKADEDLPRSAFAAKVMSQTDRLRRRTMIGWICLVLALAAIVWLLAAPLQAAVLLLAHGLTQPLVNLDSPWLAEILSPLNNVTILLAMGLIGLRFFYRKIFA